MSAKIFLLRAIIALIAVAFISAYNRTGMPVLLWPGLVFYAVCSLMYLKAFLSALFKTRRVSADFLVVTVLAVSFLAEQYLSGMLVAWFISMGLAASFYMIETSQKKIQALTSEREKTARVVDAAGSMHEVPIDHVAKNEVVLVPQGEMVPVDGEIIEGKASLDEAMITGEPYMVFKGAGDRVLSGAVSVSGQIKIRASKPGNLSFMYMLAADIAESLKHKPRMQQRSDLIAQLFIPGVVFYALGYLFLSGMSGGDWQQAMMRTAAITAVACPCAWALAVPTAFASIIGGLGYKGVLVRGGIPLEEAGKARHVVLDKTGTLTLTHPKVEQVVGVDMDADQVLRLAAAVENGFLHPIAQAVINCARDKNIAPLCAAQYDYLPGTGVKARVNHTEVILGSEETMAGMGISLPETVCVSGRAVWVAADHRVVGVIGISDELRASADSLGLRFKEKGIADVFLATGDREEGEARRVARIIGADHYQWMMTAEEKTALASQLAKEGGVIMIGDGVNDAAAMAAANVGVAVGAHQAELSVRAADIVVLNDDAAVLPGIINAGRQLRHVINTNYAWAVVFNLAGISLATAGILSPWLAALVHHGSSVFVVANSARLVKQ
ncbi:heavy metal translocating P-type ATPase [Desulfosalsimonas propionicica]|uniref:Heavy metal translocating P-type ATPase n=1 Tax=Desulfosalsimonas propionicica TaxID=332175 RepID=A0A7W0HLA1_9BACT|nr:heavy metal translocating P-type ATPase [Desulfosalsimonas propionicica]MBA2882094.1 heavy metal translocating P-type ATPase [Desulfosalsimonas propionicica]